MNDRAGFMGKSVERKEDLRFLSGTGQYTDDITLPRQTFGVFLRSPHAHARLRGINASAAESAPGVLAVITGKDLASIGGVPWGWVVPQRGGEASKGTS